MYDPRLGRWLKLDDHPKEFQSNYNFGLDNPIIFVDVDGNDDYYFDFVLGVWKYVKVAGSTTNNYYVSEWAVSSSTKLKNGYVFKMMEFSHWKSVSSTSLKNVTLSNGQSVFAHALHHANSKIHSKNIWDNYHSITDEDKLAIIEVVASPLILFAVDIFGAEVIAEEIGEEVFESETGIPVVVNPLDLAESGAKKIAKEGSKKGTIRAIKYASTWEKVSLKKPIKKFAPNSKAIKTKTGKTIYRNEETGIQIVYDESGNYFRIENTNLTGKRRYLDLEGKVPNNKITINGKQKGRSQTEYNQVTHFSNTD